MRGTRERWPTSLLAEIALFFYLSVSLAPVLHLVFGMRSILYYTPGQSVFIQILCDVHRPVLRCCRINYIIPDFYTISLLQLIIHTYTTIYLLQEENRY